MGTSRNKHYPSESRTATLDDILYDMNLTQNPTKPLYMWAGGKTKLIKHYKNVWPSIEPATYVEPFFGGGAVYSWLKTNNPELEAVIGDINFELINVLNQVKANLPEFQKETTKID